MNFKEAFLSGGGLPWLIQKVDPMIWVSIGYIALVVLIVKVFGS